MKSLYFLAVMLFSTQGICQSKIYSIVTSAAGASDFKIYTRSYGALVGIQRGKYTLFEFGAEHHWKKLALFKPRLYSVGATIEYDFWSNVINYKGSFYMRQGRINLTYGANAVYVSDFTNSKIGAGPAIGFKLLGFHLINGYNFLFGKKSAIKYNLIYLSLRYYFPVENKIRFKKSN